MKYLKYLKNFLLPFSLISSLMAAEVPSMVESWTKKLEGRKIKTYFDDESIVVRPNDYFYLCPHGKFINIVGRPAREVLRIVGADTYTGTW